MRKPNGLTVEFNALMFQRLEQLAYPVQQRVEPPQDDFLGLVGGVPAAAAAAEEAGCPGLLDVNAAGAA